MMKLQLVLVIHEHDYSDGEDSVIGVASSVEKAEEVISKYYGEGLHRVISIQDIRDSNLEYSKLLEIKGISGVYENYKVRVTLEWFNIDEV